MPKIDCQAENTLRLVKFKKTLALFRFIVSQKFQKNATLISLSDRNSKNDDSESI